MRVWVDYMSDIDLVILFWLQSARIQHVSWVSASLIAIFFEFLLSFSFFSSLHRWPSPTCYTFLQTLRFAVNSSVHYVINKFIIKKLALYQLFSFFSNLYRRVFFILFNLNRLSLSNVSTFHSVLWWFLGIRSSNNQCTFTNLQILNWQFTTPKGC